ncbi:MAG: hypothetical protein EXX96DRAFT_105774 [Benjaminiella poitrasii]|nr:MAG: hypothetical protein EXX96DRAFT_105774 [Benjaminiella poitrasii]
MPCKYRNSTEHKRFQCPRRPSLTRSMSHTNTTTNLLMLNIKSTAEDENVYNMLMAKRTLDDVQSIAEDTVNKQARTNDHVVQLNYEDTKLGVAHDNYTDTNHAEGLLDARPENFIADIENARQEATAAIETAPQVSNNANNIQGDWAPCGSTPVTRITKIVQRLRKERRFELSYSEIIVSAPKAHTEFRRPLPPNKPEFILDVNDMLYTNENVIDEGTHAPHVRGKINNIPVDLILDTGCAPCVISYGTVQKLGLVHTLQKAPDSEKLMVGDGRRVAPKEILTHLKLEIMEGIALIVDALCLDAPHSSYDFIIGRLSMQKLGIGVDLSSSYWYVRQDSHFTQIPVSYAKPDQTTVNAECFLLTVSNADCIAPENIESNNNETKEALAGLINQVDDSPILNQEQKREVVNLIEEKRAAFGVSYKGLKQTNLVKLHVDTGDAKPIMKRPFAGMTHSDLDRLKVELKEMIEAEVIIPAMHTKAESENSGWVFPCMYIPKKTGDKHLYFFKI